VNVKIDIGIIPVVGVGDAMTFSYSYADPDGNNAEFQCDVFRDGSTPKKSMRSRRHDCATDPIGEFVDAEEVAADRAEGIEFEAIHEKAAPGGCAPELAPIDLLEAP
jgi:hypothetical protein